MYQNQIIKQIHTATDIVKLVGEKTHLRREGNTFVGLCPFHKEYEPSFFVNPNSQTFHCYGCGSSGNAFSFVMQSENCSFQAAVEKLAVRARIDVPENELDCALEEKKSRLYQMNTYAQSFYYQKGKSDEKTQEYLKTRRMNEETIRRFGLGKSGSFGKELYHYLRDKGFSNEELLESGLIGYGEVYAGTEKKQDFYDRFWDRLMIPIFAKDGMIVGFGGRIFKGDKAKYLNSPETLVFDKSHELFGLHIAYSQKKSFVLCEGYFDVISMHQAGFHTAVASLGTSLTLAQAQIIAEHASAVYIAYDSDEAGVKATARAIEMLESVGLKVFVISTAPFKDVDDLLKADDENASDMKKRMKAAVPGKTFLVQHLDKTSKTFYNKVAELF